MGDEPKNLPEQKYVEQGIELHRTKEALDAANERIKQLEVALKASNDVIEGDLKARKSSQLIGISNYTVEDCAKMTVDELDRNIKTLSMVKTPYKSIRAIADTRTHQANESVPDLFMKKGTDIDEGARRL